MPRSLSTAIEHFKSKPWINKTYLEESSSYEVPDFAKTYQEASTAKGYDGFFGQTLHSDATIPHLLHLTRKDLQLPELARSPSSPSNQAVNGKEIPADLILLISLGPTGLDGWPGLAHGGLVCSLLDNAMGHTITSMRKFLPPDLREAPMYTGKIEVKFLAPVRTGREVAVLCWLTSRTEKKWTTKARIQDEKGTVLAEGESVWIVARPQKL